MAKTKADDSINKTKLVVGAIEALGGDPGPKAIIDHIKKTQGIELEYSLVASYKSNYKNKMGGGGGGTGRRGITGSVDLKDLAIVRDLLDRVGEARIHDMIRMINSLRK